MQPAYWVEGKDACPRWVANCESWVRLSGDLCARILLGRLSGSIPAGKQKETWAEGGVKSPCSSSKGVANSTGNTEAGISLQNCTKLIKGTRPLYSCNDQLVIKCSFGLHDYFSQDKIQRGFQLRIINFQCSQ